MLVSWLGNVLLERIEKSREIEKSKNLCEHPSIPGKMEKRQSVISKTNPADSETLSLSASQLRQ